MGYHVTPASSSIEAVIDDNCGMTKLLSIANAFTSECKAKFTAKESNNQNVDWYFMYKGHGLKLH